MHLAYRSGGYRLFLKFREDIVEGLLKLSFHYLLCLFIRELRDIVLELFQLLYGALRHQIRPYAQDLPQLYECGTEPFKSPPELGFSGDFLAAFRLESLAERNRPFQVY